MADEEKYLEAMVADLRNIVAEDMSKALGRFLMKWGFFANGPTSAELSRYVVAVAAAMMRAILETRQQIEQEKS